MKLYYSDIFAFPLPNGHRFPLEKYASLRARLLEANLVQPADLCLAEPASDEQLLRVHSDDYLDRVIQGRLDPDELRRIGLPWSPELVERSRRSVGGTIAAAHAAFDQGIAVNLAGGTHHAYPDCGSGFCVFNDVAVAAHDLRVRTDIGRILIVDCDVHQGDGTATIFQADPEVFTFSIHGQRNFPYRKSASDLDVGLDDGTEDDAYLQALEAALHSIFNQHSRFHFAFYLAGADPYHRDSFGRLGLTKAGLLRRDQIVFQRCLREKLPLAVVLAGGYAPSVEDIIDIHQNTIVEAQRFADAWRLQ